MNFNRMRYPTSRRAGRPLQHDVRLRLELLEDRRLLSGTPAEATGYGNLPLAFEANQGQVASQVDFLARGNGYLLSSNYGKVEYQDIYAGIDLVYYGNQGELEYDFIVAPGVDPGIIQLSFEGAEQIELDAEGNLILHTSGGEVVQDAPVLYQELSGVRQAVAGQFVLMADHQVGFEIGTYDHSRTLVIDPILSYSTYLGGSDSDRGNAIAVDNDGNAYITGYTYSVNFPTTAGALQSANGGASQTQDAFVAKLNAAGTALVYSTYLGGTSEDVANGIAVDASGNAYVTGVTGSSNFPVSAGAFQQTNPAGWYKGFVAKLNSSGSGLLYSTYLGGSGGFDQSRAIAVDGAVNDASADQTYRYAAPGNSLGSSALTTGNTSPRGIASNAAGNTVWVADANRKVYVYNASGGVLGSWTAGSLQSTAQVEGITTNGTDVWIVDNKTDKVFRYTAAAGRLSGSQNSSSSFSLNNGNRDAKGIVTDGTSIWVINDSTTDKVFKYSLTGTLLGSWTIDAANSSPTGLTIDPSNCVAGHPVLQFCSR